MKKIILLSIILFQISTYCIAQITIFEAEENLISPKVINTNDNNLLIYAYEYCYTPGSIVIEGCKKRDHFFKVDSEGEIIWHNTFDTFKGNPPMLMKENNDGTFTIVHKMNYGSTCGNVGSWPINPQFEVYTIDFEGNRLTQVVYPNDCELRLKDAKVLSDDSILVLVRYSEFGTSDYSIQTRLMLLNNQGDLINEVTIGEREYFGGELFVTDENRFELFEVDTLNNLVVHRFNNNLELLTTDEIVPVQIIDDFPRWSEINVQKDNNDNFLIKLNDTYWHSTDTTQYVKITNDYDLLSQNITTRLTKDTKFVFVDDNTIMSASTNVTNDPNFDAQINTLNTNGTVIMDTTIVFEHIEEPSDFVITSDQQFKLVGNMIVEDEPRKVFLNSSTFTLLIDDPETNIEVDVYPNPVLNTLNIDSKIINNSTFTIYNLQGKRIYTCTLKEASNAIDMSKYSSGLYFYSIENKKTISQGKIIKSH